MKLLVIDGNSIVNRAFYGIKILTAGNGQYTNAIYGFINILNSLTERVHPDGIVVAFDLKAPTFRHKMYSEYKAGRKPMPQELASQFPILKEILRLMGHTCIEIEGYEADDILGTLSSAAEKSNDTCVISTGDRDSLQLVSDQTTVLLATTKEIVPYTPQTLYEKYSLAPSQMIELKALMGDASDHIPGVPGIGEKTACDLIKRFNNIDYIYENISNIDVKESVRNKLINGKESAYLSKELGTICKEVPISLDFNDYKQGEINKAELAKIFRELKFNKFAEQMHLSDEEYTADDEEDKPKIFSVCEYSDLELKGEEFTVTIIADDEKENLYLCKDNKIARLNILTDREKIKSFFQIENLKICTEDSKNLYTLMSDICSIPLVSFDISLAGYLCSPSSKSYDVEKLSAEYLKHSAALENSDDKYFKRAANAALLFTILKETIEKNNMDKLLYEIEIPLAQLLSEMERYGFMIDTKGIGEMKEHLETRIDNLEKEICELAGEEFNVRSPAQLGVILFEKLGLKSGKKTKSGYSTTAEVLEKLKNDHPIIGLILEYRSLSKINSTYCEGLLKAAHKDGRVHSTFNQTETRTGRISSLEPNLQNIPVRREEGRELRRFFVAKEGYLLLDADYSQIELRVLAHISKDKNMIKAFCNGEDIHTKTAGEVFNMPAPLVTPQMRSRAKAVNFGIVYGIGAFSLAKDIGVTRAEAAEYIDSYFETYPMVADYMKAVVEKAKEDGFVTTMFNRRRYLPELKSSNGMLRAFGERVARNMPIQGTAADIIKLAMIRTRNSLLKAKLDAKVILQVHDELIVEVKEESAKEAAKILEYEMENAVKLSVPLIADVHKAKTWFDAKG